MSDAEKSPDGASQTPEHTYPPIGQANYALAILLIAYIFSFIDRQIISLLVEPIQQDLEITDFQISLLQGMAFALFYVVLGIPIGRLADRQNRKVIVSVGVFLWSIMTVLCGLARSYGVLFVARMGVGVGEATLSPATYSILADYYPPRLLARASSIFTMGITIGSGLAYIVGGGIIAWAASSDAIAIPFIGELKPWQLAFIAVGLPGIIVSILATTIKEPPRLGAIAIKQGEKAEIPLPIVFNYMRERWRTYGAIFGAIAILSIFGYGYLSWYPTFLIRTFEMSVSAVGLKFGVLYLVFGTAGALSSALFSEQLTRMGFRDANPRTILFVAIGLAPLSLGPLAPNATLALAAAAPTVFLLNAFFGVSIASLQLITPNQMRAVMSAVFLFTNTLVGLMVGASLVASLTDFLFKDPLALRYSLVIVGAVACPSAALTIFFGLGPYRKALDGVADWKLEESPKV